MQFERLEDLPGFWKVLHRTSAVLWDPGRGVVISAPTIHNSAVPGESSAETTSIWGNFEIQSHGLNTCCLRFVLTLPSHARLASGWRHSFTGRVLHPLNFNS
jgi:hypothetical protein